MKTAEWAKIPDYAKRAYEDLLKNYWEGDEKTGSIIRTWTGIPIEEVPEAEDGRGGIWERGMMLIAMDNHYKATKDPGIRERILRESDRMRLLYTPDELASAGSGLHLACDDCGWHTRLYLLLYEYSHDPWFLGCARLMMDHAVDRWLDDGLGGSLWYNDTRTWKSLYQVAVVMACLDIYEATGEDKYFTIAMECYYWMEMTLKRTDNIYWIDYTKDGPVGRERPEDIQEAGSVSFLGGNMGMAALHARLYKISGLPVFLKRALDTCEGILNVFVRGGLFLNDRDAWTNTTFLGEWCRDVTGLPGFDGRLNTVLLDTAISIAENARTDSGFYSAVWRGPAEDPNNLWVQKKSTARQIMTTSTGVNFIMCAEWLLAHYAAKV